MRDQAQDPGLDHAAAPGQTKDVVVGTQPRPPQAPAQNCVPRIIGRCPIALFGKSPAQHANRLRRDTHCLHAEVAADLDDHRGDARMKMHVLVSVHVVER